MLNTLSGSIIAGGLTLQTALLCTAVSLALGVGIALVYMFKNRYNQGFVATLALLPAIVQIVIMLVNGNLGTGVAVAGAFSLVRFRSLPGTARDIGSIFFAMAIGLATGMGYLLYALIFALIIGAMNLLFAASGFGGAQESLRTLRITIPETLDYDGVFDDLFAQYTTFAQLDRVKTTNMGSLYELTYSIRLKSPAVPKAFLDELRCRNGNLNIICGRGVAKEEL